MSCEKLSSIKRALKKAPLLVRGHFFFGSGGCPARVDAAPFGVSQGFFQNLKPERSESFIAGYRFDLKTVALEKHYQLIQA